MSLGISREESAVTKKIRARMAEIEAYRASLPPEERERIEREEMRTQRESWIRGMAPCEHGDPDWETCPKCRGWA